MVDFIAQVAFGVLLIMFGVRVLVQPRWYAIFRSTYMDFSSYHIFWGIVWILAGILFLFLTVRHRMAAKKKRRDAGEPREREE